VREVLQQLQAVPVVERVAAANTTMLNGGFASSSVWIQSDHRFAADRPAARAGRPGFFSTIGTQLIAGRDFAESDLRPLGDKPRPCQSVIINESLRSGISAA
jgi:hypothetical protein